MPPNTPAERECGTAELLEMVLLKCTAVDVTRFRQINSFFKGVIDRSKGLRQVMFLDPTAEIFPTIDSDEDPPNEVNTALSARMPCSPGPRVLGSRC